MATIRNTLETQFTTRGAQRTVRETEQIGRAQTRLGQASASAGRSFAAQSQGLGGLVGIYAAAAANVFAISAAFQALNASAQFDTIIRGTESLANAVGTSANQVISSLKEITGGQLSIVEAARNANLALSAGFNVDQIEQLGSVAIKASRALGRDLGDSFQRLARGAIKLEPELLDELGIFTRIEPAVNAYALSVGKSASQLTQFERRQAFANQVIKDGTDAFKDIDTSVISTQETFEKLVANFSDLAIIVGSVVADALVPLAEFLDKNLGNRILLLGSIGLIVFNSLRVAIVGLATNGIATLSASLAGLSANFASTRVTAGDLANEAADVADQFKGQGAFVGGNASEGAALKKSLAEGGVSTREAVRLKERIPELLREETAYRVRLNEREAAGNLNAEARDRLYAQSEARAAALVSTQTMVNRQLATAGPLAQNMARGLNAAAVAASALGKALSFGLRLLNAIGIIFVVLQGIGSIIGVDVFGKAREFYEYLFDASAAFKTGQESLAKVFDDQATNIRKVTQAQIDAKVALADDSGKTPNVDVDTIEDLQRQLAAAQNQKGKLDNAVFTPVAEDSEFGILAAQAAADLAAFEEKNGDLIRQAGKGQAELLEMRKEFTKKYGALTSFTNLFKGILDDSGRGDAQAAIRQAEDDLKIYEGLSKEYEKLSKLNEAYIRDIEDANARALDLAGGDQELLDKTTNLVNDRIAELEARIAKLTEVVELTTNLRSIVEISGALANSLETANPLLNDMFNAKVVGDADDIAAGFGRLEITVNGVTKTLATLNKEGFIPKDQEQRVQDALIGMDMLRKLMEDLEDGTISNTEATKKLMAIRRNLKDTTGVPTMQSQLDPFNAALQQTEERAQAVVNEFNSMNALADKLSKKFNSAAAAFDNLFVSGQVSAETGEIAKSAEDMLANEARNLTFLKEKMNILKGQRDMTGTIEEIERAITVASKASLVNQIKKVAVLDKLEKAVEKQSTALDVELNKEKAITSELERQAHINERMAENEKGLRKGTLIDSTKEQFRRGFTVGAMRPNMTTDTDRFSEPKASMNDFKSGSPLGYGGKGGIEFPDYFLNLMSRTMNLQTSSRLSLPPPRDSGLSRDLKLLPSGQYNETKTGTAIMTETKALETNNDIRKRAIDLGIRINQNGENRIVIGTEQLEINRKILENLGLQVARTDAIGKKSLELSRIQRDNAQKSREVAALSREADAAGARGASAARVDKAATQTAKILDRSILTREQILRTELNLEKVKMQEAKRMAGIQASLAKAKAKDDKENIISQKAQLMEERTFAREDFHARRAILVQTEAQRVAEFENSQLKKAFDLEILQQQKDNLDQKLADDKLVITAQENARKAELALQKSKAELLQEQIKHDKQVIADNRDLLIAEGKAKQSELADLKTQQTQFDDPSDDLLEQIQLIINKYSTMNSTIGQIAEEQQDSLTERSEEAKAQIQRQMDATDDLIKQAIKLNKLEIEGYDIRLKQLDDIEAKDVQIYKAKLLGLDLEADKIEETLRASLIASGIEASKVDEIYKTKLEQLAYELSARKKLKDLIVEVTNDINGGLANAIQKLFENAATRGASLTDGISEIGRAMYADIRKTVVAQTIVNPAQDMVKGFIGDLTGFDLNKKGIDSVILTSDGSVPVTIKDGEDPVKKVQKKIEKEGADFFTSFKEKAKGAFDSITSSLGDFGSKAMETFRGLGGALQKLFVGEGGIMKSLSGFMKGLFTGQGEGVGSSIFNIGKTIFSFLGTGAPAPVATGGLIGRYGVLNMAAGGQVNALRDRVPAMLEPGEFVMRRPAAKSIGAGNLSRMNATGAAGMGNVQFNIVNEGEPKSAEQQGQPKFDADKIVIDVVMRDLQSNGPIRNALRSG